MLTEASLFPGYEAHLIYGALSLDKRGLVSYGACAIRMHSEAIAHRTTVMEDNSFAIARRPDIHADIWDDGKPGPVGFRSTWAERHKLAAIRFGKSVRAGAGMADHAALLLQSDGDRANDIFMETHTFGIFNASAVAGIRVAKGRVAKGSAESACVTEARDRARTMRIDWTEA
jgi:hypothetical protein